MKNSGVQTASDVVYLRVYDKMYGLYQIPSNDKATQHEVSEMKLMIYNACMENTNSTTRTSQLLSTDTTFCGVKMI